MGSEAVVVRREESQPTGANTRLTSEPRLFYIDNLRILLTILVILFHLAIGYGAAGDWIYEEEEEISLVSAAVMTTFVGIDQAFFMGFFFMLSGYFTPAAYGRKGAGAYLKDRLMRLGIPLLFYEIIIHPLLIYAVRIHGGFRESFGQFVTHYVTNLRSIADGPLWFVETLLLFSCAYAAWRLIIKPAPGRRGHNAPGNLAVALFALTLGVVSFVVRIWLPVGWWFEPFHLQLAHFPQYIALFILGILAHFHNWFDRVSNAQGRLWRWIALLLVPLFPAIFVAGGALEGDLTPFMGGLHWQSLAYAVWEQFMCVAMVITLLVWFRNRFNHQGKLASTMSRAAYAVYIVHAPVIVLLALALSSIRLDPALKFILLAPVAVPLCFVAGHVARKLPLARNVL